MPFKSEAQQRFMFAKHPGVAKRWAKETPNMGKLPKKLKKKDGVTVRVDWNEEDHPRDENGKFGEGGGGDSPRPGSQTRGARAAREGKAAHKKEEQKQNKAMERLEVLRDKMVDGGNTPAVKAINRIRDAVRAGRGSSDAMEHLEELRDKMVDSGNTPAVKAINKIREILGS